MTDRDIAAKLNISAAGVSRSLFVSYSKLVEAMYPDMPIDQRIRVAHSQSFEDWLYDTMVKYDW